MAAPDEAALPACCGGGAKSVSRIVGSTACDAEHACDGEDDEDDDADADDDDE